MDLCKSLDVHVANGRCGFDASVGKPTSTGGSILDYVILSPYLFPTITHFEVLDFDPMISDVHSAIVCEFAFQNGRQEIGSPATCNNEPHNVTSGPSKMET